MLPIYFPIYQVNIQKQETMLLRKALQECKACRIKRPECSDDPPPCFPKVECRDTNDGPVCGPCPQGRQHSTFCTHTHREIKIQNVPHFSPFFLLYNQVLREMEDSVNETNALKIRVILVSIAMILKVLHSLDVVLVLRDIGEMVSIVYHLPVNKDHRHVSRYISFG